MSVDRFYDCIRLAIAIFLFGNIALYFVARVRDIRRRGR